MPIKTLNKGTVVIGDGSGTDGMTYKFLTNTLSSYTFPNELGTKDNILENGFRSAGIAYLDLNNAYFIPSNAFYGASFAFLEASNVLFLSDTAFAYCNRAVDISMNNLIAMVGGGCFAGCTNLSNLYFPNIISISGSAFGGCTNLKTINCSKNLLYVGGNAFAYCSNLEFVDIGFAAWNHGYTFANCSKLKKISFSKPSPLSNSAFTYCRNLEEVENDFLFYSVVSQCAFSWCSKLKKLNMPFVSEIQNSAFYSCLSLSEITLGHSPIGSNAFANCSILEKVILLTKSTSVPSLFNINAFSNTPIMDSSYLGRFGSIYVPSTMVSAFRSATNWALISDRITSLPSEYDSKYVYAYEFYSRSDLAEIPSEKANCEIICASAFYNCNNLSGTLSNSSIKLVGPHAFWNNSFSIISLPNCSHVFVYALQYSTWAGGKLKSLFLPNCLVLDYNTLSNQIYLESYNLDKCRIVMFGQASKISIFSLPEALSITLESCGSNFDINNSYFPKAIKMNLTYNISTSTSLHISNIKDMRVYGASHIEYIDFPDAIIGNFGTCSNLKSYNLPNVVVLAVSCFSNAKIEDATFNKINIVPNYCFASCRQLKKAEFLNAMTVYPGAFSNCSSLSRVLFRNLTKFSGNTSTFYRCYSLESLYLFSKSHVVEMSYSRHFDTTPITQSSYLGRYGSIYVPARLLSEYQTHSNWSYFSDRFVGLTDEEIQDIIDHWND